MLSRIESNHGNPEMAKIDEASKAGLSAYKNDYVNQEYLTRCHAMRPCSLLAYP